GAVVQNVMVRRPDLLSRVVLIDPAPPDGLKTPPEVYPFLDMYRNNRELLKKALIGTMPTRPVDEFTDLLVDEALLMDPRCFTENARALEKYDYTQQLKGCEIPVLVIVGRKDMLITEEMARGFERIMHTVHVRVLEEYGHSINVENPGLFVDMLLEFTSK
ncbi:MAG TPA: alpha/beta hydrolase, partial [Mesotoga sp.]|nr:alpha/beta hydrolase [Mesotoga sp.]